MSNYKYLLLDADNTLLDFDRAERTAFCAAFSASGLTADDSVYEHYQAINGSLWKLLEQGEISRERLKVQRFETLLSEYYPEDVDKSAKISKDFFAELSEQRFLLPGALDVCRTLSTKYKLYIVTNGSTAAQKSRFAGCGLEPYIEDVFISEEMGAPKPATCFFDGVFSKIGDPDRSAYLIVGDSLTSDIDGAIFSGVDAVWIDRIGKRDAQGRTILYIIDDIRELLSIV